MRKDEEQAGTAPPEKRNHLDALMRTTMEKVREMVDTNTIVGAPITTPDGVTLIPVSRVRFGFGTGGGSYGKTGGEFGGGAGAGVNIDPVAFLTIKDGVTRLLPVGAAPMNTVDRIVDMAPDLVDKVENFMARRKDGEDPA